jgi:hypothetical protein
MLVQPRCSERECKHFRGVSYAKAGDVSTEQPICAAFPNGIPLEIAYGENLHLLPIEGDSGIQYEREPEGG